MKLNILMFIGFIMIISSCKSKTYIASKENIKIDSLVSSLAEEASVEFGFLKNSKEFQYIWNNPNLYFDDIMMFLKNIDTMSVSIDLNEIQKSNRNFFLHETEFVVLFIMMSNLELSQYLKLSDIGLEIFKNGLICDSAFHYVISGSNNDSPILNDLKNYKVRYFFRKIVNSELSEEYKNNIRKNYLKE